MKIHFLSNSLKTNSGFANVTKNLMQELKKLGYDVTMSGMQTSIVPEYTYGIKIYPIMSFTDEESQFIENLMSVDPDVVIYVGEFYNDICKLAKVFPRTLCLLPNSPILTLNRGVQEIKNIKIGDKVLTHNGRFMRVNETFEREYQGDMIKIISHKLKIPMILTPEHKVLAIKTLPCIGTTGIDRCRPGAKCYTKNGYKRCKYVENEEPWRKYFLQWIDAKNLCVGDLVVYPKSQEKELNIDKIKISDYIDDFLTTYDNNQKSLIDYFSDDELNKNLDCFKKTIKPINSYNSTEIPLEIELNKDFMRLCGYFIAEGGIIYDDIKQSYQTYFAFNINEEQYINDVKYLMKNIFRLDNPYEAKDNNSNGYNIRYSGKIITSLFMNLFAPKKYEIKKGRGKKSNIVRIPSEFLNLPLDKLKELIKGIWRGDGSFYNNNKKESNLSQDYSISTTSLTLAHQLMYIMSKFNIMCSIEIKYNTIKNEKWEDSYDIAISGQDIKIFESIIDESFINRESFRQVNKYIRGEKNFYIPIKNIDIIKYNGFVYNIEIEDDNSYVAPFVVHNCYSPIEDTGIPHIIIQDLNTILMKGGKIIAQCSYGFNEMVRHDVQSAGFIYHGYNEKIFKPLDKSELIRRYCFYSTEVGKESLDPRKLCDCYNCTIPTAEQIFCPKFKDELIIVCKYKNGKWTELNDLPIYRLKEEFTNKFVYLFVGQNHKLRKKIDRLLIAFSLLLDSQQMKDKLHLHLHTQPQSNTGINLLTLINNLGIQENVSLSYGTSRSSGWSEEALCHLYNMSDVGVTASSSEGFGLPILEGMSCGKPQIAPDCTSMTELIGKNQEIIKTTDQRGLLAKIGDTDRINSEITRQLVDISDLSTKMKEIYTNKELRKKCSENCLEFVKPYTWNQIVLKWDKLIKNL